MMKVEQITEKILMIQPFPSEPNGVFIEVPLVRVFSMEEGLERGTISERDYLMWSFSR